jgi:hypothetical protein
MVFNVGDGDPCACLGERLDQRMEYNFYLQNMRKRNLSAKQSAKIMQINEKFLNNLKLVPKR